MKTNATSKDSYLFLRYNLSSELCNFWGNFSHSFLLLERYQTAFFPNPGREIYFSMASRALIVAFKKNHTFFRREEVERISSAEVLKPMPARRCVFKLNRGLAFRLARRLQYFGRWLALHNNYPDIQFPIIRRRIKKIRRRH